MRLALVLLGLMLSACQGEATWVWHLPAGFPEPPVPSDNPMSATKVELGRRLFYDTRLSVDGEMACATCHKQELAFTDGRPVGVGTTGEAHTRSSMSLANVAYASRLSWADPDLDRLEDQARAPLFGEHPETVRWAGMAYNLLWVTLGNIIGGTLAHEVAHSLGLADPEGSLFHNNSNEANSLMDSGSDRPFHERAQLAGGGPEHFCRENYEYLRNILPSTDPDPIRSRPPCY